MSQVLKSVGDIDPKQHLTGSMSQNTGLLLRMLCWVFRMLDEVLRMLGRALGKLD